MVGNLSIILFLSLISIYLDPVFFLHHTQVDRLWWIWQQRDPGRRLHEFSGPRETFMHMDNRESSLDDTLYAGTIGKNIQDEYRYCIALLQLLKKFFCFVTYVGH
jgi:hypothetical protein